jgi:tRNA-uridine 2-sulfurtransferase
MGQERVIVAMSGGVDSSVAAARLRDEGYDVVGVTLHLWDYDDHEGARKIGRCCAPEDQYDARRTADALGFAHYTFDRRELFAKSVVDPFVEAYLAGETPSPCAACNRAVKLAELAKIADRLGAARIATGHYARVARDADGTPYLAEGRDAGKDQSYFLYAAPGALLERLVFPLGESTKDEVRREARARRLPGADKGESQELCFVGAGAGAYAAFVESRADGRVRPGAILDRDGRAVGTHEGIHRYTVGQRKGLGVALGEPRFVSRIDAETGAVWLGSEDDLFVSEAVLDEVVLAPKVSLPRVARVRVRYRHAGAAAEIASRGGARAVVRFTEPARAVARGQVAVFYDGDRVLGGGRIDATGSLGATLIA